MRRTDDVSDESSHPRRRPLRLGMLWLLAAAALALAGCSDRGAPPEGATAPLAPSTSVTGDSETARTYSGRAMVVEATVAGNTVHLADTGPLPPEGGSRDATLVEGEVPGVLTAEAFHATTVAQGKRSHSEASVASLEVTVDGHTITADFVMSQATARCAHDGVKLSGSSTVSRLVVDGREVEVSGEPNQTVDLSPAGQVTVNGQHRGDEEITVKALRVVIPGTANIIVSRSHADIHHCDEKHEHHGDFVTGGGWIEVPGGGNGRANFGVAGGIKNGGLWGHLTYVDHPERLKVKGVEVTDYVVVDENTRRIEGRAQIRGGEEVDYAVTVTDAGEPGRGSDEFRIRLSNGYERSGTLGDGNIQLHEKPAQGSS